MLLSSYGTERTVLCSWKEVAAYLGKSVRTVQRWEQDGLPIRRVAGASKIVVQRGELDQWLCAQPVQSDLLLRTAAKTPNFEKLEERMRVARELQKSQNDLCQSVSLAIGRLLDECSRAATHCRRAQ